MFNKVTLMGRVVFAPEVRKIGEGEKTREFVTLSIATNGVKGEEQETMFHSCSIWNENIVKRVKDNRYQKGNLVYLEGTMHPVSYKKKDGTQVDSYEINVNILLKINETFTTDLQKVSE